MNKNRNSIAFWAGVAVFLVAVLSMTQIVRNEYPFFAGYVILQFIALAVAWSILGVAESIVLTMLGASWAPAISFAMLLGVLAVRPQGLLGR